MNTEVCNEEVKNEDWKRDGFTLRVRGSGFEGDTKKATDPVGLSRSILHVLNNNDDGYVKLMSVGPTALNIALKAFRIASDEIERKTDGAVLVIRQSEYITEINGRSSKGICTRIFAIPIKYAS
jgi:hypothetical protein